MGRLFRMEGGVCNTYGYQGLRELGVVEMLMKTGGFFRSCFGVISTAHRDQLSKSMKLMSVYSSRMVQLCLNAVIWISTVPLPPMTLR